MLRLFSVIISIAILGPYAWGQTCHELFGPGARSQFLLAPSISRREAQLADLEARLSKHFGDAWKINWSTYQPGMNENLDVTAAQVVFKKLKRVGSDLELELFDAYLAVKERTTERYETSDHYFDMFLNNRAVRKVKASQFQSLHWEWGNLDGYFFNENSVTSFEKEADLAYLKFVAQLASRKRLPIRDLTIKAQSLWHKVNLSAESTLSFRNWLKGRPPHLRRSQAELAISELDESKRARAKEALSLIAESESALDQYIFSRYIELLRMMPPSSAHLATNLDPTSFKTFEQVLNHGDPLQVANFLIQNSYDTKMKDYLARTLEIALSSPIQNDFESAFNNARVELNKRLPDQPTPEHLQTDLRMFIVSGYQAPLGAVEGRGAVQNAVVLEVQIGWNAKLGMLRSSVENRIPIANLDEATVGSVPALKESLDRYFDELARMGEYSREFLERHRQMEFNSPLRRSTYMRFTKPGSNETVAMLRMYDGSELQALSADEQAKINRRDVQLIPLERDFPHLKLPARLRHEDVRELGRLYASSQARGNSLPSLMARIADYLRNTSARGSVHFDGVQSIMRYHKRNGATVIYTPEQLHLDAGQTQMWVMEMSVEQIIEKFYRVEFEAVQLRADIN